MEFDASAQCVFQGEFVDDLPADREIGEDLARVAGLHRAFGQAPEQEALGRDLGATVWEVGSQLLVTVPAAAK